MMGEEEDPEADSRGSGTTGRLRTPTPLAATARVGGRLWVALAHFACSQVGAGPPPGKRVLITRRRGPGAFQHVVRTRLKGSTPAACERP